MTDDNPLDLSPDARVVLCLVNRARSARRRRGQPRVVGFTVHWALTRRAEVGGWSVERLRAALHELLTRELIYFGSAAADYSLTHEGVSEMRRRKQKNNNPTNPDDAADAARNRAVGSVVDLEDRALAMVLEVQGASAAALFAVRHEVDLWESAAAAMSEGLTPPRVCDVPQRHRVALVEAAVEEWRARTSNTPCAFCGTIRATSLGFHPRGYLDADDTAAFMVRSDGSTACRFCFEYVAAHGGADALRRAAFGAIAGVTSVPGFDREVFAQAVPFASEVGARNAVPWQHLTEVQRDGVRKAAATLVHGRRFCRTPGAAAAASLPGLPAPQHGPAERPRRSRGLLPDVTIIRGSEPTFDEQLAALREKHREAREKFLRDRPREHGFNGTEVPWSAAVDGTWEALLARQHVEVGNLVKRSKSIDGRSRGWSGTPGRAPMGLAR